MTETEIVKWVLRVFKRAPAQMYSVRAVLECKISSSYLDLPLQKLP